MNTIAEHIADFLKKYPPFDNLTFQELSEIATSIRVMNIEKHKTLFQINDVLHDSFYVVASGVINLSVIADAEETLLNKCIEGDVFGLRPFFAKNSLTTPSFCLGSALQVEYTKTPPGSKDRKPFSSN